MDMRNNLPFAWLAMPPRHPLARRREFEQWAPPGWANMAVAPGWAPVFPAPVFEELRPHPSLTPDLSSLDTASKKGFSSVLTVDSSDSSKGSSKHRHKSKRGATGTLESALRELNHQLATARALVSSCLAQWRADTKGLGFLGDAARRAVWQDLVLARCADADDNQPREIGRRITTCMQQAHAAMETRAFLTEAADDYQHRRRQRVVQKLGLDCEDIVATMEKALREPESCEQLLQDIGQAVQLVASQVPAIKV